jgi:hypothetical protein
VSCLARAVSTEPISGRISTQSRIGLGVLCYVT